MNKLGFYGENGIAIQSKEKHIIENIKRILLTRRGERICDLSFGSDLRKYLFQTEISIPDVISEIRNSIIRCEPRVEVLDCVFKDFNKIDGILKIELTIRIKEDGKIVKTDLEV